MLSSGEPADVVLKARVWRVGWARPKTSSVAGAGSLEAYQASGSRGTTYPDR